MECVECSDPVDPDADGTVVIQYCNFAPEYRERYGFCADHAPGDDEIDEVKERIRAGELLD